jgi:hypothetical protein
MTRIADTAVALQIEERLAGLLERYPLASWSAEEIASWHPDQPDADHIDESNYLRTVDVLTLAALGVVLPAGCTAVEITLANDDHVREARCLYGSES